MKPKDVSVTAGLYGLNWQVQVDPLSLSITSLPVTLLAVAVGEEVPDDALDVPPEFLLPPQALASKHIAATTASQPKRFIDTLRSLAAIASSFAGLDIWE